MPSFIRDIPWNRQLRSQYSPGRSNSGISVIIPTYNRAHVLPRALDSVLNQSLPPDEIIVVDDGSSDATTDLIKQEYPEVTLLAQNNAGVSSARNLGINHASRDWIALLDSDDEWLPSKLQAQRDALQAQPNFLFCHSDEIWIRNGKRVNPMNKHRKFGGYIFQQCLPLCAISPSTAFIKKSLLVETGLFDESLPACEDYDLWLRICAKHPVLFLDEFLINKYGGHDDQLSRQHWGMDRFRIQALEKVINSNQLKPDDRKAAINCLNEKCQILESGALKRDKPALAKQYRQLADHYSLPNSPHPSLSLDELTGNRS